jgi:hypothetical protein
MVFWLILRHWKCYKAVLGNPNAKKICHKIDLFTNRNSCRMPIDERMECGASAPLSARHLSAASHSGDNIAALV